MTTDYRVQYLIVCRVGSKNQYMHASARVFIEYERCIHATLFAYLHFFSATDFVPPCILYYVYWYEYPLACMFE